MNMALLKKIARLIRYYILISTTKAGSGHPTSSLSAVELMVGLMFGSPAEALALPKSSAKRRSAKAGGFFRFDPEVPEYPNNDRLIFSKGHACPLLYALWAAAGRLTEQELLTLRKFNSPLEGHPAISFPYTEVATGSLGHGLSIGAGMALNAKYLDKLSYRTYVLLGDSEFAEGSVWEAMELAAYYKLDNLIGILDVNRLGQRGETIYGYDLKAYQKRIEAFGWETIMVDGHDFNQITKAYQKVLVASPHPRPLSDIGEGVRPRRTGEVGGIADGKPKMIIAKTIKGKGVSFLEDKNGWHGHALSAEELAKALEELGGIDKSVRGKISKPFTSLLPSPISERVPKVGGVEVMSYPMGKPIATRKAYGNALARIYPKYTDIVVLDGEVSNSTYAEIFKKEYPQRFFEMFIAEQNMVGVALGLALRGKIPFVSTFAAFLTRAFDQIRMSQYSKANIKFCGSHGGVSIGEDGPSQMGLEDLAMFRTILGSVVLYPSDAISTDKLVEEAAKHKGIVYIRTTRKDTPIIYRIRNQESGIRQPPYPSSPSRGEVEEGVEHDFRIGGSCVLRSSEHDMATVVAAGITLHEALAAYEELRKEGINIRVIDLYSVKPLDIETLYQAAEETKAIIVVEDHYAEGGIGEAVASALFGNNSSQPPLKVRGGEGELLFYSLAVRKMPRSGRPEELLEYEEISAKAIVKKVKELLH